MNTTELFETALGIEEPWYVTKTEFRTEENGKKALHIYLDFHKGGRFTCPECECTETGTAYDTRERTWRHLDFFQYKTYIHAWRPRFRCPKHGVHFIPVPWAKEGSGFTLLFEAMCLEMAKNMPMAKVAEQVDEYDTRVWRFVKYYVEEARKAEDFSRCDCNWYR